jgi:hypothetical protein
MPKAHPQQYRRHKPTKLQHIHAQTAVLLWPVMLFKQCQKIIIHHEWELYHKELNLYHNSASQSIKVSHDPFRTPFLAQCDYFSTLKRHIDNSIPLIHTESHPELLSTEDFYLKYQHGVWLNSPSRKATCSIGIIWGALQQ